MLRWYDKKYMAALSTRWEVFVVFGPSDASKLWANYSTTNSRWRCSLPQPVDVVSFKLGRKTSGPKAHWLESFIRSRIFY